MRRPDHRAVGDAPGPSPGGPAASWLLRQIRPWLGLGVVCAGFSLNSTFLHTFWTRANFDSLAQQAATNIIVAVGMTFVIITGGIDLSVGSVMALSGVALGLALTSGPPPFLCYVLAAPVGIVLADRMLRRRSAGPIVVGAAGAVAAVAVAAIGLALTRALAGGVRLEWALLVALGVGLSCGMANGVLVTAGRVPPFVVTLGMLTTARALTLCATDGNSVSVQGVQRLAVLGKDAGLLLVTAGVVALGMVLLARTRAGRYMTSIGGNEEASRLSGIDVGLWKTVAYTLCGLTAAVAAVVLTAKFGVADTGAGVGAELNGIAAVVIGGTSLSGGQGSVIGSLAGALTIAVLNSGMVLVGVPPNLQGVVIGGVIVATVMADRYRSGRA